MMVMRRWVAASGVLVAAMVLGAGCGNSGGETGAGGGSDAGTPTCEDYCTTVTKNCADANAVYVSKDVCLAACKELPVGTTADTTGNTLGCRSYHAGAAASNATLHCPHAGPGGAGYCGTNCEGYCNLAQAVCSTYQTQQDCLDICKTFKDMEPFSAQDVSGNTLQCRLYHASVAAADPTTHCPHIGVMPTAGTCTDATP
jgi:hypothetical protein